MSSEELLALTPVSPYPLSEEERAHCQALAEALAEETPALRAIPSELESMVVHELPKRRPRQVLLDDFSVISHIEGVLGLEFYTSRAFVRAGEGDVVLGTFPPIAGYPAYMAERLGLGLATHVHVPPAADALPFAVCQAGLAHPAALEQVVQALGTDNQDIWLHPYMGHQRLWALAIQLQKRLPVPLKVVAPPPVLCDLVNNKPWFLDVVRRAVGAEHAVPSHTATCAQEAVEPLREYAQAYSFVSTKLADSASGMGTGIFPSEEILALAPEALSEKMTRWLHEKDWVEGRSPAISVEPWLTDVHGSPSVQLWIPPTGTPLVEGIYDQLFYADDPHVFLGSIPSQRPAHQQQALAHTGAMIGHVFQLLGYVGRCSFDTILSGPSANEAGVRYVECNGRWGGTSTPMTLNNRVFGDYRQQPYVASDFDDERLKGMLFQDFVSIFDDILYDVRTQQGWAIVYNVGCLQPAGKLDIMTLGATFEEAQKRQEMFRELVETRLG